VNRICYDDKRKAERRPSEPLQALLNDLSPLSVEIGAKPLYGQFWGAERV